MLTALIKLLFTHSITDLALQTRFIGMYKSPLVNHPSGEVVWPFVLTGHAMINGAGVAVVTGNIWLGVAESVAHGLIDYGRCTGLYGMAVDQMLHYTTKVVWAYIWASSSFSSQ